MKFGLQVILGALACTCSQAATNVSYNASSSPNAGLDGNSNSVNVWSTSAPVGTSGYFLGNSGANGDGNGAGAGSSAWAMYANSGGNVRSTHTFDGGALAIGQNVSLNFDNGYIDSGGSVGLKLFDGTSNSFEFFFQGGLATYRYSDSGGTTATTANFSDDGGVFSFTLNSATTYSASFRGTNWSGTITSITSVSLSQLQVYNSGAGGGSDHDVFFNNLSVVPEPTNGLAGMLAGVGLLKRRRRHD